VLLGGITEQFDYNEQEVPWEDLSPTELHDEVCRVHNTVFAQLGAVVSNMTRFLRGEEEIRAFLVKMCTRSQLVEEQVVQLNVMLERALERHNTLSSSPDGDVQGAPDDEKEATDERETLYGSEELTPETDMVVQKPTAEANSTPESSPQGDCGPPAEQAATLETEEQRKQIPAGGSEGKTTAPLRSPPPPPIPPPPAAIRDLYSF
jgi:hypothetical protein